MKRNKIIFHSFLLIAIFAVLASCDGTKHLKKGETLYLGPNLVGIQKKDIGEDYKVNKRTDKRIEVWTETLKSPNGALMGVPFIRILPMRLYMYNWFYTSKEKGFNHWVMNNFGEPPISISQVSPDIRVANAEAVLFGYGHFDAKGSYEIKYRSNGKKAKVFYKFEIGPAYQISSFDLKIDSNNVALSALFKQHVSTSTLLIGEDFNLQKIEEDRLSLIEKLQNNGYFYLNRDNVLILADTTSGNRTVQLRYQLANDLSPHITRPVMMENIYIRFDSDEKISLNEVPKNHADLVIDYDLLSTCVKLKTNSIFRQNLATRSVGNLSSLNVLKGLRIKYVVNPNDSSKLDAIFSIRPANRYIVGLEGAVTTKSSHFAGPMVGLRFTQKNVFNRAINITHGIDTYLDFPTGKLSSANSLSTGLSLSTQVAFPLKKPVLGLAKKNVQGLPKGLIGVTFELNDRKDYFKLINLNNTFGIGWKSSRYISHRLDFVSINYNNLLETTLLFDTLLESNAQLQESFKDRFFIGPHYTFIYNNTRDAFKRQNVYFQLDFELSGNIVNGIQGIVGSGEAGNRTLFGLPYAQYARIHTDFRYYYNLTRRQKLIFRITPALGYAYGNSDLMPYVKQFYIGGTNSLRPLGARVIGPGTYLPSLEEFTSSGVVNTSGDVLIEGNLEYRFPILYKLNGALWGDFGNVYLIKDDPLRPGGQFEWSNFIQKMIVTGGVGLRLDFDYLVLRYDLGYILYYPWGDPGERWAWENGLNLFGGTISIGYPF